MKAVGLLKLPFYPKIISKYFLTIHQVAFLKYDLYIGFIFFFILSISPQKVKYSYTKHTDFLFYYDRKTLSVVLLFS